MANGFEHLFICLLAIYMMGEVSVQTLHPIKNWVIFLTELYGFFVYFGYKFLIRFVICKNHLSFCELPFYFGDVLSYEVQKLSVLIVSSLLFLLSLVLLVSYLRRMFCVKQDHISRNNFLPKPRS
jgi:hypothetical protein